MTNEDAISILEIMQSEQEEKDFLSRCALDIAIEALKAQKSGEWIEISNIWETEDLSGWGYWKECSSCHCQEKRRTSFCPNCGADMRKGGDGE